MNGQIRVRSELGKGTIFGIELPFEHADTTRSKETSEGDNSLPPMSLIEEGYTSISSTLGKATEGAAVLTSPPDGVASGTQVSQQSDTSPLPQTNQTAISAIRSLSSPEDSPPSSPFPNMDDDNSTSHVEPLFVLIAEDNPINARLVTRRLQKLGHKVEVTHDGQECYDYFASKPYSVDVILMDLQMPLVDGALSARMIRNYEKNTQLDGLSKTRPRVPIIAVSASLTEENRYDYIEGGFDAWILKPIDFARLDFLLRGVKTPGLRRKALYMPGMWARGGWFLP
jgi:CheY-like chemotaxis protein